MKAILMILLLLVGIIGVGILVGWIFKSTLAGILTVGGLIVIWAFWWLIRKIWAKE